MKIMKIINPKLKWKTICSSKIFIDTPGPKLTKAHRGDFYKSLKLGYKYAQKREDRWANYIAAFYSILNAIYNERRVVFVITWQAINDIMKADANFSIKSMSIKKQEYQGLIRFFLAHQSFKVHNPNRKGKEALILELTDPDFLFFFDQSGYLDTRSVQIDECFNYVQYKSNQVAAGGAHENNPDQIYQREEGSVPQTITNVNNEEGKKLNVNENSNHRTQNLELRTQNLEPRTSFTTSDDDCEYLSDVLKVEDFFPNYKVIGEQEKKEEDNLDFLEVKVEKCQKNVKNDTVNDTLNDSVNTQLNLDLNHNQTNKCVINDIVNYAKDNKVNTLPLTDYYSQSELEELEELKQYEEYDLLQNNLNNPKNNPPNNFRAAPPPPHQINTNPAQCTSSYNQLNQQDSNVIALLKDKDNDEYQQQLIISEIKNILGGRFESIKNLSFLVQVWPVLNIKSLPESDQRFLLNRLDWLGGVIHDKCDRSGKISQKVDAFLDYMVTNGAVFSLEYLSKIITQAFLPYKNSSVHKRVHDIYQTELKRAFAQKLIQYEEFRIRNRLK